MAKILFDASYFRSLFPEFVCTPPIPDSTLQVYFDTAELYISNSGYHRRIGGLQESQRKQALYLMTAHLAQISRNITNNNTTGVITQASVDKVSITLASPPAPNQWQYWLQSTPYGQQLLALLSAVSVGGLYVGARPEISAFNRGRRY